MRAFLPGMPHIKNVPIIVVGWWKILFASDFSGLVLVTGPITNTYNAVSSLYPVRDQAAKYTWKKWWIFCSKELLTCFVGGVMRFYHRFHVILAFTLTAYGSSITYIHYTYSYMLFGTKINDFSKRIILYKSFVYPKQKRQKCFSKWDVPLLTKYMT